MITNSNQIQHPTYDWHEAKLKNSLNSLQSSASTKDVCTSTLEQRFWSFILQNLWERLKRALVLDCFTWCHHHPSTNSVKRVGEQGSSISNSPSQSKASEETILKFLKKTNESNNGTEDMVVNKGAWSHLLLFYFYFWCA